MKGSCFVALLEEAKIACTDRDWRCPLNRLLEFQMHMKRHRKAEPEAFHPKLASMDIALANELEPL